MVSVPNFSKAKVSNASISVLAMPIRLCLEEVTTSVTYSLVGCCAVMVSLSCDSCRVMAPSNSMGLSSADPTGTPLDNAVISSFLPSVFVFSVGCVPAAANFARKATAPPSVLSAAISAVAIRNAYRLGRGGSDDGLSSPSDALSFAIHSSYLKSARATMSACVWTGDAVTTT